MDGKYFILSFISIIPQFVAGLLYGYIRMKFGFFWCVFSHFYYNLFVFGYEKLFYYSLNQQ
jgi:hypothetical protein